LKTASLGNTLYLHFGANDTSGSGGDGATPAAHVRKAGAAANAAPVLSPTPVLLSHEDYPAGCYEVAVAATEGNGFEASQEYAVFCTLAIDSQNPTGFIGEFKLDPLATRADVYSALAGALSAGVLQEQVTVLDNTPMKIVRGDVKTLVLTAEGWDLTGKKVCFIAKADPLADNSTAIVNRECTVTDAAAGVAEIILTAAETAAVGKYYAEFEQRDNDGSSNPKTIRQLDLIITQDVRQ
jgi:hypothetical protein